MSAAVYFLLGAVFGAFGMAARIVDKYEREAKIRGYCKGWEDQKFHRKVIDDAEASLGRKLCAQIRFGAHGNLKRWQPIDEPFKPKKANKK